MPPCEFHWLEKGCLAGCGRPGLFGDTREDHAWLWNHGIRHLVCLTETHRAPPHPDSGLEGHHFPIVDMSFPRPRPLHGLCNEIASWLEKGEATAIHCRAGLGRTGLVLACILVDRGESAARAIKRVRQVCANYIQTSAQEQFVHHFKTHLLTLESQP